MDIEKKFLLIPALLLLVFSFLNLSSETLIISTYAGEDSITYRLIENWLSEAGELAGVDFRLQTMSFTSLNR